MKPMLDENGLIRSDGRLAHAEYLSFDVRYPVILPQKSWVTKLIIKEHHEQGMHACGTNHTLAALSAHYWIVSGREAIREWERECMECRRRKAKACQQIMAPLPLARLETSMRAFTKTAVDFAGPFVTVQGRGKRRQKRYLCLFTCMTTRAVHLELAYGLDTDSFMNAFYRMTSCRGLPDEIYSDNGTNFKGADNELKSLVAELDKDKIKQSVANKGVKWNFNPPMAPHFGGVHNSMIKSAKRAIKAILGNADVTDEELMTAIIEAEGLINSRPLTYQTADPSDDVPLMPNHFLHGQIGGQFAPTAVDETDFNPRKRWRRVQELVRHFWHRWLREWLPELSARRKWFRPRRDLKVDDVALVMSPDTNRGNWPLGRVLETYPGKDGRVRMVKIQVDGETGKTYSYADVISRSERLAAGLQTLGVDAGDVVCTLALNHLDYPVTFYATALLAAVFRPVNPSYTEDEIYRVLKESETRVLFTTLNLLPSISKAKRYLKHLQVIILGDEKDCKTLNYALEPQETPYRGIDSILAAEGTDYTTPEFNWKSQIAVLLPSGGTTGFPKAIQLSHFALIANGMQMSHAGMSVPGETLIVFLPLSHGFGLVTIAATSHSNVCKLILMPRFEQNDYLRLIKRYKPTVLHVVPPILTMFAKDPVVGDFDFSSVKRIFCGGSPLSSEIETVIKNKFNLTFIQQGYGMTEAGVTHVNKTSHFRGKSVGKHMDLVKIKIIDVDTGESLGPNRSGEIWLKGPQVATGYLNLPAHNKDTFLKDGWVRTGDIGKEDDDGFLYIIDRIKDLITHEKNKFAPATLEDILLRHEAVADAAIIGVPDVEAGELPRAYIVLKMGMAVTETELQHFVAGLVDDFMRLRGGVMIVNEIPRSPSGKILRRNIRKAIGLL